MGRPRTLPEVTEKRTSLEERRPEEKPSKERPGQRPRIRRDRFLRLLPWAVAVLAVAAAVTFAVLWMGARGADRQQDEVVGSARDFLQALTNFSARNIDQDVEEIGSFAVGRFAEEVESTFSEQRTRAIRESEAVSTGRLQSVFVQALEDSAASVFAVVRQTIVNRTLPAPRVDVLRVELEMIETADGWRVSSVQILQSPGAGLFG
jgi:hypothetical protein